MNFTPEQLAALESLARIWKEKDFVLIGASALAWHLGPAGRQTQDLDIALAVDLAGYPAGLDRDPEWARDPQREHCWVGPHEVQVDVLPVPRGPSLPTVLRWPRSGQEMSLAGLRHALELGEEIRPAASVTIRVAPLEVVALLKMVAYLDRPHERTRDLADLALILDAYVEEEDPRRYGEEIIAHNLDFDQSSPFLLGRRLGEIAGEPEWAKAMEFIEQAMTAGSLERTQARMLAEAPAGWLRDPGELIKRFQALAMGLDRGP